MSREMPTAAQFTTAKDALDRALYELDSATRRARGAYARMIDLHERQAIATDDAAHKKYAESMAAHYLKKYQGLGG